MGLKARVKATGEIVNVYNWGQPTFRADNGDVYQKSELDFDVEDENNPNYWDKLLHQYAGMAMQGLMSYVEQITPKEGRSFCDEIVDISFKVAHALVEKMKEER